MFNLTFFAQNSQPTSFFIQSMIHIDSQEQTNQMELKLRENQFIKMCRIDFNTKTLLIITQNVDKVNSDILKLWLEENYSKTSCVNIGVYGKDKMLKYPLTNCK